MPRLPARRRRSRFGGDPAPQRDAGRRTGAPRSALKRLLQQGSRASPGRQRDAASREEPERAPPGRATAGAADRARAQPLPPTRFSRAMISARASRSTESRSRLSTISRTTRFGPSSPQLLPAAR